MNHSSESRVVAGLMSGTSLDGIDAVLTRLTGSGVSLTVECLGFRSTPIPSDLKELVLANSSPATSDVKSITQLNVRLAYAYAEAVRHLLEEAGPFSIDDVDAIGCHGQTVYHVPDPEPCAGLPIRSTFQLGDPSTLAQLLHTTVVGDFRLADMAAGGQGAPLAPYLDYVLFRSDQESRALLNIGGIANVTVLPAGSDVRRVIAFDTGPGNMIIDALAQRFWGIPYDAGGAHAASGTVRVPLLEWLLDADYYRSPPPKSTGREFYNDAYVEALLEKAADLHIHADIDIMATATAFTAETIAMAYESFIVPKGGVDRIIVSGGGIHNDSLVRTLRNRLPALPFDSIAAYGINADAKEAICFAVLAHETLNEVPANLVGATGAERPVILGKICLAG